MSEARVTALVTCAGSMPGVAVINALKRQDELPIRVVAADAGSLAVGSHLADASARVPYASDPGFIPAVLEICRREGVGIVFPIIDEELPVFAENRGRFEAEGIRVITNEPGVVATARDKYRTYQACRRLGLAAPATYLPGELLDAADLRFPLIVKPRDGRGTVGVFKARDRRELEFFVDYVPNALIQEYLDGPEYTIDILTDFAGRILGAVPKLRIETKAGMQVKGRTVRDDRLIGYGVRVAEAFGLVPRGNVQCIDVGGVLHLVEINPKFAASLPFTVAAGVNAPLLLVKMHLGQAVPPAVGEFRAGLVMLRYWQEVFLRPDP